MHIGMLWALQGYLRIVDLIVAHIYIIYRPLVLMTC
jgi:hypothetical protein